MVQALSYELESINAEIEKSEAACCCKDYQL